jgi:hypothetical protein
LGHILSVESSGVSFKPISTFNIGISLIIIAISPEMKRAK